MEQKIINGKTWDLRKSGISWEHWTADYFCSDGDSVVLYVNKNDNNFELSCISGIGCSNISIDSIDFGVFQYVPNKIDNLNFDEPFNVQCIIIADYLCRKFCEIK